MPVPESHTISTAGEHFVAYRIAACGFLPAFIRHGIRKVDILASTPNGSRTVGLVVKCTRDAVRESAGSELLVFPFSGRFLDQAGPNTLFCFVDLREGTEGAGPDVFVIPREELDELISNQTRRKYAPARWHVSPEAIAPFKNEWRPLYRALGHASPALTRNLEPRVGLKSADLAPMLATCPPPHGLEFSRYSPLAAARSLMPS